MAIFCVTEWDSAAVERKFHNCIVLLARLDEHGDPIGDSSKFYRLLSISGYEWGTWAEISEVDGSNTTGACLLNDVKTTGSVENCFSHAKKQMGATVNFYSLAYHPFQPGFFRSGREFYILTRKLAKSFKTGLSSQGWRFHFLNPGGAITEVGTIPPNCTFSSPLTSGVYLPNNASEQLRVLSHGYALWGESVLYYNNRVGVIFPRKREIVVGSYIQKAILEKELPEWRVTH